MSRNIKFRAWNGKTKAWAHEDPCSIFGETILLGGWLSGVRLQDLNEIVVEQYTGLRDRDGVEIYEGDICSSDMLHGKQVRVMWSTGQARYMLVARNPEDSIGLTDCTKSDIKIIGNIHTTPELLEGI